MAQTTRTTGRQLTKTLDKMEFGTLGRMEAAYGTALATAEIATNFRFKNKGIIVPRKLDLVGSEDQFGGGSEFRQTPIEAKRDLTFDAEFYLSSQAAALLFCLGLGKVTTTDNLDTSYTHAIIPFVPSATAATGNAGNCQPPPTGIRLKYGPTQGIADGVCLNSLEVSGAPSGIPDIKASFIGNGKFTADANAFQSPATVNELRLINVQVGVAASEESIVDAVRNVSFKWNNNLRADEGYVANSDIYRGQLLMGQRDYELELTFDEHSTDTELAAYLAQTAHKAILTYRGAVIAGANYHELIITLNALRIDDLTKSVEDIYRRNTVKYKAYAPAAGNFIDVSVKNTSTGYLVLDA